VAETQTLRDGVEGRNSREQPVKTAANGDK
jgi:hypothetical protein